MAQTTLQEIIGKLVDFLECVEDSLSDKLARLAIVADLGGDPSAAEKEVKFPPAGLANVKKYRDAVDPDLEAFKSAVTDIRKMIEALHPLADAIRHGEGNMTLDEATRALLDLFATNCARLHYPRLYYILQALSFAEEASSVYGNGPNAYVRFWSALKKLVGFVFSPVSAWNDANLDDETDARQLSDYVLLPLAVVLAISKDRFKVYDAMYGWDIVPGADASAPTAVDRALARMLTFKLARGDVGADGVLERSMSASIAFVPKTQGGKGVFLSLGGGYEVDAEIAKRWSVIFKLDTKSAVNLLLGLGEDRFQFSPLGDSTEFGATLAFEGRPERDSQSVITRHSIDMSIKQP
jgi:hypothetical protein